MATELTQQDLSDLAVAMMELFDNWRLGSEERLNLLGLQGKVRGRHLSRFREGEPLPNEEEILIRARRMLLISDSLSTSFPHNAAMANYWISTPNRTFAPRTPLQVMLEEGLEGIRKVHASLDCMEMWI